MPAVDSASQYHGSVQDRFPKGVDELRSLARRSTRAISTSTLLLEPGRAIVGPAGALAHARPLSQDKRRQAIPDRRRRHERPHPALALQRASRHRPRDRPSRRTAPSRHRRPHLRDRRFLRPGPRTPINVPKATSSPSSTPEPMACRSPPTTTRAPAPPKFWSTAAHQAHPPPRNHSRPDSNRKRESLAEELEGTHCSSSRLSFSAK